MDLLGPLPDVMVSAAAPRDLRDLRKSASPLPALTHPGAWREAAVAVRAKPRRRYGTYLSWPVALALAIATPMLVAAAPLPEVVLVADVVGAVGLATLPASGAGNGAAVLVVQDSPGFDGRSERYARQLAAAGLLVLEIELDEPDPGSEVPGIAAEPLQRATAALAAQPGVDPRRLGAIGFGRGASQLLRSSATPPWPFAALVLLYPGCEALLDAPAPAAPTLILHGGADEANTDAGCERLVRGWTRAPAVRRVHAGASYAWDKPTSVPEGRSLETRPDGAGRVEARFWPERAELAAAQVTGFLATRLTPAAKPVVQAGGFPRPR